MKRLFSTFCLCLLLSAGGPFVMAEGHVVFEEVENSANSEQPRPVEVADIDLSIVDGVSSPLITPHEDDFPLAEPLSEAQAAAVKEASEDQIEAIAIPEPSAFALLACLGMLLFSMTAVRWHFDRTSMRAMQLATTNNNPASQR